MGPAPFCALCPSFPLSGTAPLTEEETQQNTQCHLQGQSTYQAVCCGHRQAPGLGSEHTNGLQRQTWAQCLLCHLLAGGLHFPEPVFLLELHEIRFIYSRKHSKLSVNGRRSNKVIMIFASHSSPLSLSSKSVQKTNCSACPPGVPQARRAHCGKSELHLVHTRAH